MNAVFVHDHNFVFDFKTQLYYDGSGGAFDENLWMRYLAIFDKLTVVGRQIETLPNNLVISSTKNVSFNLMTGIHGISNVLKNQVYVKQRLESTIKTTDFVIIRLPSRLGAWAFEICKKLDKKYVLEIVGDPYEAYLFHGNWLGKIVAPIELFKLKRIAKLADNVIYVTKETLQQRYPCPNNTNAISNVRLEKTVEAHTAMDFYNGDISKFKIGLIGSFHVKYKGHVEAILALKRLKDKGYSNIELHLVGTGDSAWVRTLAKKYDIDNQLNIVGSVEAGDAGIFPFLDQMHLYIHPSKTEGLPRVILEAMSRGKICLGSDVGGTNELLQSRYIHKPGDWEKLAAQIEDVVKLKVEEKKAIVVENLGKAQQYLEPILQEKRSRFINMIISNGTT